MSIRFGDIQYQSQKLSEIAPNFSCFLPSQNFVGGTPSKSCTRIITAISRHVSHGKVSWGYCH